MTVEMALKTLLDSHLIYIGENETHYLYRCPFCGDSLNPHHGHLYVSKERPVFYCVRCGRGGSLQQLLKYVNSAAADDTNLLNKLYIKSKFKPEVKRFKQSLVDVTKKLGYPGKVQEEYLKQRLGKLSHYITDNWASISVFSEKYQEPDGISFTTLRGKFKIKRYFNNSSMRYKTTTINKTINSDVFMLRNFDGIIDARTRPYLVIGEGIFDILAEYNNNMLNLANVMTLYVASLGKSKFTKTMQDLCLLLLKPKFNMLYVIADNDILDSDYRTIFARFADEVIIVRNPFGKDWADV